MNRCQRCCIPDTRPDTAFVDGVCSACLWYDQRPSIDWDARRAELHKLLERHANPGGYDCIVPSSGGKDSTWQVLTLIEMGARPLVVTASTCHLTPIGRANIDNLARYATTIEVSPNKAVRAKLNRLGLELVGDISWPEHLAIFATPFQVAVDMEIPLIFYGENPQNQYGGPLGTEEAKTMTRRWVTEFGGHLGLRPADVIGQCGITERDMDSYRLPSTEELEVVEIEAHFLGQYLPWDSNANANKAIAAGMRSSLPTPANWWEAENLDNAQTGLHDYGMFLKYGLSRIAQQLSVDVRNARMTRGRAMEILRAREGKFPEVYAGVPVEDVLDRLGMTFDDLWAALDRFTNRNLFRRVEDGPYPPMFIG